MSDQNGQDNGFHTWAIVEIMGHNRIAGELSEQTIAGADMLRVDVPEISDRPAFTVYYSAAAIYSIKPTDEATARLAVENLRVRPVSPYIVAVSAPQLVEKIVDDDEWEEDEL